ncbi:MAG: hypothetical protein R6U46_09375, partial [Marinilabilia sp.]
VSLLVKKLCRTGVRDWLVLRKYCCPQMAQIYADMRLAPRFSGVISDSPPTGRLYRIGPQSVGGYIILLLKEHNLFSAFQLSTSSFELRASSYLSLIVKPSFTKKMTRLHCLFFNWYALMASLLFPLFSLHQKTFLKKIG